MSIPTQSAPERITSCEVSEASLTVHLMPQDQQIAIDNSPVAIRKRLRQLDSLETAFAICEASGGYERNVLTCCTDAKPKERGKPSKVILTAIMRKLIVIMNAVLKEGQASNRYGAAQAQLPPFAAKTMKW